MILLIQILYLGSLKKFSGDDHEKKHPKKEGEQDDGQGAEYVGAEEEEDKLLGEEQDDENDKYAGNTQHIYLI